MFEKTKFQKLTSREKNMFIVKKTFAHKSKAYKKSRHSHFGVSITEVSQFKVLKKKMSKATSLEM